MQSFPRYLAINPRQINRTTLMIRDKGKQNNFMSTSISVSYVEKVAWVVEPVDYDSLQENQIDVEYAKLRKELHAINDDVAKALEKMSLRGPKKHRISEPNPSHTLEVRDRQIDNNNSIMERLKKQFETLQKRTNSVVGHSKDDMEEQIRQAKQKIVKMRQKIKELTLKNKSIGNSIMNTDQLYDEIRRLQNEKQVMEKKKMKLQNKTDSVYESIASSQMKLEEISDDYTIAENYFEQFHGKNQQKEELKQIQTKLRYAKHCLQVTQKKGEISQNTKQQKYHVGLKNLQNQMNKVTGIENKTRDTEMEIINSKKMIIQLQTQMRAYEIKKAQDELLKQDEPVFFTEYEDMGLTQNNDKNSEQKTSKISHNQRAKVKTENEERLQLNFQDNDESQIEQIKHKQKMSIGKKIESREKPQRIQTSNGHDPEEEQDVIMELDEKFNYGSNQIRNKSRVNEKQTELDEDFPEDEIIDDHDDEMIEFQSRVSQQRHNSKKLSKGQYDLNKDLSEVEQQLKKIDFASLSRKSGEIKYDIEEEDDL